MRYVVATRNRHKLAELERLLAPLKLELLPEHVALPPETGATFRDNALLKARTAAAALDRPVLADDSGLCVAALGGRPGVRSARYAGEGASDRANLEKLVREMSGRADRRADDRGFGDRRRADAVRPVLLGEARGDLEHPAALLGGDIFTKAEHARIIGHRLVDREVERLGHGDLGHQAVSSSTSL